MKIRTFVPIPNWMDNAGGGGGEVGLFCTRKMNKKYPFSRKFKFENTRVLYEFLNQVPKTRPPPLILLFFSPRFNIFLVEKNQPKFYIYIYISFPSKFEISFRSLLLSKDNLATPCTHTHAHTHTWLALAQSKSYRDLCPTTITFTFVFLAIERQTVEIGRDKLLALESWRRKSRPFKSPLKSATIKRGDGGGGGGGGERLEIPVAFILICTPIMRAK